MKRWLPLLALALLLAGCSFTLSIPMGSVNLPLPSSSSGVPSPVGYVIYTSAMTFETPSLGGVFRAVRIQGQARLEQPASLNVTLFARLQDPAGDSSCTQPPGQSFYLCSKGNQDAQLGQLSFSGNTGPVPLDLQGQVLLEGVRQGKIWFGLELSGWPGQPNTLHLENLVAQVTVGL